MLFVLNLLQIWILMSTIASEDIEKPKIKRWCHRENHGINGTWKSEPPYWELPGCPNQAFGVEATRKCMTGRTLYVIGNSIARQNAFGLMEMLGGAGVKREDQRDMCPKVSLTWSSSCAQELGGVKFRYLSLQYLDGIHYENRGGFPFYKRRVNNTDGNGTHWETGHIPSIPDAREDEFHIGTITSTFDNCKEQKTSDCLARFLEGSTEHDVLIFTMGMWYTYGTAEDYLNQEKTAKGDFLIDYPAWIAGSAVNFKAHISRHFKGTVFRTTLAAANPSGGISYKSAWFKYANDILNRVWTHSSDSTDNMWYTIDQWPINQDRDGLYVDNLHFTGILTHATLHQMLNELCTGEGDNGKIIQTPRVDLADSLVIVKEKPNHRNNAKHSHNAHNHTHSSGTIGEDSSLSSSNSGSGSSLNAMYYVIDKEGLRHEIQFDKKSAQIAAALHAEKMAKQTVSSAAATTGDTSSIENDHNSHGNTTSHHKTHHIPHVLQRDVVYLSNFAPLHLSALSQIELPERELWNISLSFPYTELKEGTLIKGAGKEVFWFRNQTRQQFGSLGTFMKYGFDFDQVVTVTHLSAIPEGSMVT